MMARKKEYTFFIKNKKGVAVKIQPLEVKPEDLEYLIKRTNERKK